MYSHEASISFSSNSISAINNVANEDIESLKTWLEESKLSLNVAKIQCILIGSRNKIRAQSVSYNQHKYLGVQIDQYLNW